MTVQINVKADMREVTRALNQLQKKVVPAATNSALNKTAAQVRTAAKRAIAKQAGLPQKIVNENLNLFKSSFRSLRAIVQASGKALNLIRFKARQTRKGVTATAWGKRKLYKGTFIANAGRTVFKRQTAGGKRVGRLPIEPVHGPSIPREFISNRVQAAMRKVIDTKFPTIFAAEVKRRLGRLR